MPSALTTNAILARERSPPKSQFLEYGQRCDKDPQQKHRHRAWRGRNLHKGNDISAVILLTHLFPGVPAGWWKEKLGTAKLMGAQVVYSVAD